MTHLKFSTLALALILPLAACGQSTPADSSSSSANHAAQVSGDTDDAALASGLSEEIQKAMQQAKQELASKNIDVNNLHVGHGQRDKHSGPSAEITPQGELLIDGKKVAATPAQQILLMDYRKQIVGIAEAGMDIGTQGADLGINAAKQALWGALSGKSDEDIEAAIKPQTDKIEAAALKLCERLPELLSSQQKLASAMPEFQPYATMEQKDIDDCGKQTIGKHGKKGFAIFSD